MGLSIQSLFVFPMQSCIRIWDLADGQPKGREKLRKIKACLGEGARKLSIVLLFLVGRWCDGTFKHVFFFVNHMFIYFLALGLLSRFSLGFPFFLVPLSGTGQKRGYPNMQNHPNQ